MPPDSPIRILITQNLISTVDFYTHLSSYFHISIINEANEIFPIYIFRLSLFPPTRAPPHKSHIQPHHQTTSFTHISIPAS